VGDDGLGSGGILEDGLPNGGMLVRIGSGTVCKPVPSQAGQVVSSIVSPVPEHSVQGTILVGTDEL
jgi:hypothetical protein